MWVTLTSPKQHSHSLIIIIKKKNKKKLYLVTHRTQTAVSWAKVLCWFYTSIFHMSTFFILCHLTSAAHQAIRLPGHIWK